MSRLVQPHDVEQIQHVPTFVQLLDLEHRAISIDFQRIQRDLIVGGVFIFVRRNAILRRKTFAQLGGKHVKRNVLARKIIERTPQFVMTALTQRTQLFAVKIFHALDKIRHEIFALRNFFRLEQHNRLDAQVIVAENFQAVLAQNQRAQNSVGKRTESHRDNFLGVAVVVKFFQRIIENNFVLVLAAD